MKDTKKAELRRALADAHNDLRIWQGIAEDPEHLDHHVLAAEEQKRNLHRIKNIVELLRGR